MADHELDSPLGEESDWYRKESLGKSVLQIGIAALVLFGGLGYYYHRVQTKKRVHEAGAAAKVLILKDNPKNLIAGEAKLKEALELDGSDGFAISSMALVETLLWHDHAMADHKAAADEWVAKAEDKGGPIDEHFSAYAMWLLDNGKVDEASTYLKGVVERASAGAGIANALGRIRRAQGNLAEARAYFKKAHDLGWRTPRFACDLADSYFEDGDYINAEGFYAKGLDANSEHLRSQVGQARARIARAQNLKQAEDVLAAVLARSAGELSPELKAMALTGQAELRRYEQQDDEGLKLADAASAAQPGYAWAYEVKGALLADKGDAGAAAAFDKAIALDKSIAVFYFQAAKGMAKLKDAAKADGFMAAYAKILKVDDRYHVVYGDLSRDLGNLDKAQAEYTEAIKSNGLNAMAHFDLGTVLSAKSDYQGAADELNKALGAQQTFPEAHNELGKIKFAQNAYPEGCEEFAQALVQLKLSSAPREKIDALLDDVNQRLIKAKQKGIAKLWMEQGRQLVR